MLTRTVFEPETPPRSAATAKMRDPRLDFFRGLGLFIIFIAHVPFDEWALWIPARFGFSDATEIFVFLSGMASALAFGKIFDRSGALALTARIAQRIWQIYWAHIGLFVAIAGFIAIAGTRPDGVSYIESINLSPFFTHPASLLPRLMTLTYVPNYFDILPMYMVILAMMPVMLLSERVHRLLPFGLMAGLWLAVQLGALRLPAEPWSTRPWFFNPFGWQLIFFTGFFLRRGSLPSPAHHRGLTVVCAAILVLSVPLSWYLLLDNSPLLKRLSLDLLPLTDKSAFGLLRYVHFLAIAYLAAHLMGPGGRRLRGPVVEVMKKVGQQSLAVFITSMFLAQVIGVALDQTDRSALPTLAANLVGFAVLTATAYLVSWFKSAPWKSA